MRNLKTCLNEATLMPYDIITNIKACGEVGFEGIEIWFNKLQDFLKKGGKIEELVNLLSTYNLKVAGCCGAVGGFMFLDPLEFNKKLVEIEENLKILHKLECEMVVVCPDVPPPRFTLKRAIEVAGETLKVVASICEKYNIKIGLEPLGMHPFVPDIKTALKILEVASHEYVGLTLDTFHMYKSSVPIDDIRKLSPKQIAIVHIDDCEDLPKEKLTDANRLFPGEGVIPLIEFLRAFKDIGYQGFLSVEIFREEYWKLNPLTIARRSKNSLEKLLEKVK